MFRDEIETSENHFSWSSEKNEADSRREFPGSRILADLWFQAFVFLKQVATDPLFEVWRRKAPAKSFKNLILIIVRIFIIITIILIPSIIIIIHPSLKIVWQGICKADI